MPIRTNFVQEDGVRIGKNLDTGYNVVIRKNAIIGDDVCIWTGSIIDPDAVIGNRVKIHVHCYISQGCVVEDDVFMGPGVKLLNDKYPPRYDSSEWEPPIIKKGAIIGGGAIIGPGVVVGEGAKIGCGAVVLRDVPDTQLWVGLPAKRLR